MNDTSLTESEFLKLRSIIARRVMVAKHAGNRAQVEACEAMLHALEEEWRTEKDAVKRGQDLANTEARAAQPSGEGR